MLDGKCEVDGCVKKADHIGSLPETGIIDMCSDCWNKRYKQ
jgi:hypothetical protein